MKKIAPAVFSLALLMLLAATAWAQTSDQGICNGALVGGPGGSLGDATGCGALITVTAVNASGQAIAFNVTIPNNSGTAGNGNPYDGDDDVLVGVLNNSNGTLSTLPLSSSDTTFGGIFGFDGDGPCDYAHTIGDDAGLSSGSFYDCFNAGVFVGVLEADPVDYEGPDNTFTVNTGIPCATFGTCSTSGTVVFTTPLAPSSSCGDGCIDSTWFALEGTPNSLALTSEMQTITYTAGTNETQTASFGTGANAHSIGHTIPTVNDTFTVTETANYVDTEFSNGGITGPGIVDGICEFPPPNPVPDNDLDCREAAGGFVFETLSNGDQVVPHAPPYHGGQAVWYRASTTALAVSQGGHDYAGPVADIFTFATNLSLTSPPVNPEYAPGWNNLNGRVYDRPGTNTSNAFVADITTYFDGDCCGAGGKQPTMNDWVLAAVPNPQAGAADTEITLLPLPKPSPAPYVKGLPMPVSFALVNTTTKAPDPTALTTPNAVNISTRDSLGNNIPVQFPNGFPITFTCLTIPKFGCAGVYSIAISSTPYQKPTPTNPNIYNMQIGSDLFSTPVNIPFVVK